MTSFEQLAVKAVVNACGTLTKYGGSIMHPDVLYAMREASANFVDMKDAQAKVGARIAALLGVPAAYVCAGASAGLLSSAAACMVGTDPHGISRLPTVTGVRREIIVHRAHRNDYDQALRTAGAVLVEIGGAKRTYVWELEKAISAATAAIVYFAEFESGAALPFRTIVGVAKRHSVPVIVDAAAELPPVSNFRRFLDEGADLAIFSGGKDIRGPQTTGLILGHSAMIEAIALNASPNYSVGRSLKVGKEELMGFLRALELYLAEDHDERLRVWEAQVATILEGLAELPGIRAFRKCPSDNGIQPAFIPRVYVELSGQDPASHRAELVSRLLAGDPPVAVGEWPKGIAINPHALRRGEEELVVRALRRCLGSPAGGSL